MPWRLLASVSPLQGAGHLQPFRVSSQTGQTGQAHSKKIRDLLKIGMFDPKWTLPSQLDNSPMAWMLEVDGFILDIRTLPLAIQVEACARGLIPYVPALRQAEPAP